MHSQKCLHVFLLLAFLVAPVLAQIKPDLSGTWVANRNNGTLRASDKIVIEQKGPEIKIVETLLAEEFDSTGKWLSKTEKAFPSETFYTDKRGDRNTGQNNQIRNSSTKWDGNTVVITRFDMHNQKIGVLKFSLEKDGTELKIWQRRFSTDEDQYAFLRGTVFTAGGEEKVYKKSNK